MAKTKSAVPGSRERNLTELGLSYAEAETILQRLANSTSPTAGQQTIPAPSTRATPSGRSGADTRFAAAPRRLSKLAQYQTVLEAVPDALVIIDQDGFILLVNAQTERLFSYPREELLGQPIEKLVPDRFREAHPNLRNRFFGDPHIRPMGEGIELYGRHRDGHDIPVEISLSPFLADGDTFAVSTIRDITERRKTEAHLRSLEARFRSLVENIPAVTFMAALDGEANELYVSPQIESLLGFSQAEWLGNPVLWYTQLHQEDRQRWHIEFAHTCSTGEPFRSIYRFLARDGRVVWVQGEAKMARDTDGKPLFLQGVAFDITLLKEAEEELRQLNQTLEQRVHERTNELAQANGTLQEEVRERMRAEEELRRANVSIAVAHQEALAANKIKSQFLANMSHELRTPLNAIIGYSELLQVLAERRGETGAPDDLGKINQAGKYLLALINDILDLSKIEAGKMQLYLETFDVIRLIHEAVATVEQLATKNSNKLIVQTGESLGTMHTDVTRLRQCLLNLLSNACKFTKNGTVTMNVTRERKEGRDWLSFQVRDTGIGIAAEQISRLFHAFSQADATTTRRFGGTGLGLSITKSICLMMGGDVDCESALGNGSTFTVRLPALPEAATRDG